MSDLPEDLTAKDDKPRVSKRKARLRIVVPLILVAAVLGLATTAVVLSRREQPGLDEGSVTVARQAARNFFSLDYRRASADTARVLALATGSFARDYAAKRATVAKGLAAKKAVLTATIADNGAAVEYQHGASARVLVAVDATTTIGGKQGTTSRYRVRVHLTRHDDTWRVSAFDQVG